MKKWKNKIIGFNKSNNSVEIRPFLNNGEYQFILFFEICPDVLMNAIKEIINIEQIHFTKVDVIVCKDELYEQLLNIETLYDKNSGNILNLIEKIQAGFYENVIIIDDNIIVIIWGSDESLIILRKKIAIEKYEKLNSLQSISNLNYKMLRGTEVPIF